MSLLPKTIHRFDTIPIKILMADFTEVEKIILKFMWNLKRQKHLSDNMICKTYYLIRG